MMQAPNRGDKYLDTTYSLSTTTYSVPYVPIFWELVSNKET